MIAQKISSQYIVIFVLFFLMSCVLGIKGIEYMQQSKLRVSSDTIELTADVDASSNAGQALNPYGPVGYAGHLLSVNADNQGCGCPSCCQAM